jgi:hypothetical protein
MRESVRRGLDLGGVALPGGRINAVLVGAALPVDELPDDVRMARVLRLDSSQLMKSLMTASNSVPAPRFPVTRLAS